MRKFESVLDRVRARELSQLEAAEILGMSERTFRRQRREIGGRRWRDRHAEHGLDGRLGKASAKRVPVDEIAQVLEQ